MRARTVATALCALAFTGGLARASVEEVRQALGARRFAAAAELCERELQAQPADPQLWTLKGLALEGGGRPQEALASYRKAAALEPDYRPALEAEAQLEYRSRDPQCRRTLNKIVALDPASAPAHGMLGALAYEEKRCADAVAHFEKAGAAAERNPAALWQYGNCLYETHRIAEAARKFEMLLAAKDNDLVRYNLGLALLDSKQAHRAAEILEPLGSRERPDSDTLSLLAAAYQANKQTPLALATLRRAAALYPREERHYIDFASLCVENTALDIGLEALEAGAKNIPDSARLHATLGALLVRAGRTVEAENEFQKAQKLDPAAAYGVVGLGLARLEAGEGEESIRMLRSQLAAYPDSAMVQFMLAQALMREGSGPGQPGFEEARKLLIRAVALDPRSARAHGLLGKNYAIAGDTQKAIPELETTLRLEPNDRTSAYQLVLLYGRAGRKQEQEKWRKRTRELMEADQQADAGRDRYRILRAAPRE